MTDDTGRSSDGTRTVSDDCTSFPELRPSLSLRGERAGRTKAGRAALSLPSDDICSRRDGSAAAPLSPRCRSIYLHLCGDLPRFFSAPNPRDHRHPPLLRRPLSAEGIQRSDNGDNDSPLSTFQIRAFYSPPSCAALSFLILSLSIFSYSLVLMRPRPRIGWAGRGWAWLGWAGSPVYAG